MYLEGVDFNSCRSERPVSHGMYSQSVTDLELSYEYTIYDIMSQYAYGRTDQLTEKEVWIGSIMGRSGAGSRLQREQSDFMKSRFNRELCDIVSWMEDKTSDADRGFTCLAVACLYVAVRKPSTIATQKLSAPTQSFAWFAAGLCLPELIEENYGSMTETASVTDGEMEALRIGLLGLGR